MRVCERIVADTNCLVSRLLLPSSVPGDAAREAVDSGLLLVSEATMNELADVLGRRKGLPSPITVPVGCMSGCCGYTRLSVRGRNTAILETALAGSQIGLRRLRVAPLAVSSATSS